MDVDNPPQISYDNNFWQGYSILQNNFLTNNQHIYELFYIFSQLSEIHLIYSKSLDKLCSFYQPLDSKDTSVFSKAIISFIDQLKEESNNYLKLSQDIKSIADKKIHATLNQIATSLGGTNFQNIGDLDNEYGCFKYFNQFKIAENNCKESFKKTDVCKKEYYDEMTSTLKENVRKNELTDLLTSETKQQKIKLCRQAYINQLQKANDVRDKYVNTFSTHAKTYQDIDTKYMKTVKESIIQYIDAKKEQNDLMMNNYHTKVKELFNNLDFNNIQLTFVEQNHTPGFPPDSMSFVNYSLNYKTIVSDFDEIKDSPENKKKLQIIQQFVSLFEENATNKNDQNMRPLFDTLMNGSMENEQLETLIKQIKNNEGNLDNAITFLSLLNNQRTKKCVCDKKTYDNLVEILAIILQISQQENISFLPKYKCLNWIVVMSQTFCFENENNKKIYLLEELIKKNLFKNVNWFKLLQYVCQDNLKTTNYYMDYKFELTEEDLGVIKGIVEPKIVSLLQNMVMTQQSEEVMDSVIDSLCNFYKLPKDSFVSIKNDFITSHQNENI